MVTTTNMSRIVQLHIKNFRRFADATFSFGNDRIVCLVGRGDSGKSTILDALYCVLAPSRSLSFCDADFHFGKTSEPIVIECVVVDPPETLLSLNKFGTYLSGFNQTTGELSDATDDQSTNAICVRLTVGSDLEPIWEVVNQTSKESIRFGYGDRSKLNVVHIADFVNRHFGFSEGTPLARMMRSSDTQVDTSSVVSALREAKDRIDSHPFSEMSSTLQSIVSSAKELGIDVDGLKPSIDAKALLVRDGGLCLHDGTKVPLRMRGKGSRRILSFAIQTALSGNSTITLIDEIEQGLEPDRAAWLAHMIKANDWGQVFMTTHSASVVKELAAADIFLLSDSGELRHLSDIVQGLIRKAPEFLFGKRIILCEGATEVGVVRGIGEAARKAGRCPFSLSGTVVIDGGGSSFVDYAKQLFSLGFPLRVFCDSDRKDCDIKVQELESQGITVFKWEDRDALEDAVFRNVSNEAVSRIIRLYDELNKHDSDCERNQIVSEETIQGVRLAISSFDASWLDGQHEWTIEERRSLGKCAKAKNNSWFKRIDKGERLGMLLAEILPTLPEGNILRRHFTAIEAWGCHA